tara:strand:- start:149 stop:796 length:648 start_codon:yes stop_codon:yes gene_type:complete
MNFFELNNILKSITQKINRKKIIYIELTALTEEKVQCQYSVFYDLKFYYGKKNIKEKCRLKFLLEYAIPISKINNEIFFRILYYYLFPNRDQAWTNNYKMNNSICTNPKNSSLIEFFFSESSQKLMMERSKYLLESYTDNNTKIFFFITPVYQKINHALEVEKKLLMNNFKNLIKLNTLLDKNFFNNCNMYADTIHLSKEGVTILKNKNTFFLFQ